MRVFTNSRLKTGEPNGNRRQAGKSAQKRSAEQTVLELRSSAWRDGAYDALNDETKARLHSKGVFSEDLLSLFSDAFVSCRYFYEHSGFIFDGIPTFIGIAKALREVIEETNVF